MLPYLAWLWVLAVYIVEVVAFAKSRGFLSRLNKMVSKEWPKFQPFASVIVPCKGAEPGLAENIKAILSQAYKKAEYIFVVDSKSDPAYSLLKKFAGKNAAGEIAAKNLRIITAKRLPKTSGKVSALIAGVKAARGKTLVFADSDIRPGSLWLRSLVEPLQDKSIGAVTGYRWYFPSKGFASCLRSSWNTIGLEVLLSKKFGYVWGGSNAILASTFRKLGIEGKWVGEVSDDTVTTNSLRRAGLAIHFAPGAMVATINNITWPQLVEWSSRQVWFVRNYFRSTWHAGMFVYGSYTFILLTGIAMLLASVAYPWLLAPALLVLFAHSLKALRFEWLQKAFLSLPQLKPFVKKPACATASSLLVHPLATYNFLKSRSMRSIEWRGARYSK